MKFRAWLTIFILIGTLANAAGCSPAQPTTAILATAAPATLPSTMALTSTSIPASAPANLANPGFEQKNAAGVPTGWESAGAVMAARIEERGHSGSFRLTHRAAETYQVQTSQVVSGLANGWYTLSAWVRAGGQHVELYLELRCGEQEARVSIPATTPGYRWIRVAVSSEVTGGQCTVRIYSFGTPDSWASFDDIELTPGRAALSILGADISSLKKSEDLGGVYRYHDGNAADALQILKDNGLNYARLRVWVDPADGYHNKAEVLAMALRLKALGIKLLVDFHYSDDWADPGKQYKPAAWKDYDLAQLRQAVYDHTFDVCSSLAAQGTPADMVQIGNEINAGILWPDGDHNHFDNLAALLTAGYRAAKDASTSTVVMLHVAEGGDNEMARWFFDNLTHRDVPFDVIGVSFYPFWHGSLAELQANLNDLSARYDKDVLVAEFAYAFTVLEDDAFANIAGRNLAVEGYLFTPDGQRRMTRDVMAIVRGVPGGRGLGVFYWDATWTAVPGNGWNTKDPLSGNGWENQALFDFNDKALPALAEYLNP
ncbi:MAG: glycosyl hydrolase 53 family protein [Chloroflexota bacterium]